MSKKKKNDEEPSTLKFAITILVILLIIPLPFAIISALTTGTFSGIFEARREFTAVYVVGIISFIVSIIWELFKGKKK